MQRWRLSRSFLHSKWRGYSTPSVSRASKVPKKTLSDDLQDILEKASVSHLDKLDATEKKLLEMNGMRFPKPFTERKETKEAAPSSVNLLKSTREEEELDADLPSLFDTLEPFEEKEVPVKADTHQSDIKELPLSIEKLEKAIESQNPSLAMAVFKELDMTEGIFSMTPHHLEELVQLMIQQSSIDIVSIQNILDRIQYLDIQPTRPFYNHVLYAFAQTGGSVLQSERLLNQMKKQNMLPSIETLNHVMMNYIKSGHEAKAFAMLHQDFPNANISPNEETFALLIDFYLDHGNQEKVGWLVQEMEKGHQMTSLVGKTLCRCYLHNGDSEKALNTLQSAIEDQVVISSDWTKLLFQKFIELEGNELSRLTHLVDQHQLPMDSETLELVLNYHLNRQDPTSALNFLRLAMHQAHQPPLPLCEWMNQLFCQQENTEAALQLFQLFKDANTPTSISMNETLLEAVVLHQGVKQAFELFKDMKRRRLHSTRGYNALLVGLNQERNWETSYLLWREMKRDGMVDALSHRVIFETAVECDQVRKAKRFFEDMCRQNISFPGESVLQLFELLVRKRCYQEAGEVLMRLRQRHLDPNEQAITSAFQKYSEAWESLMLRLFQSEELQFYEKKTIDILNQSVDKSDLEDFRSLGLMIYKELLSASVPLHPDAVAAVIRAHTRNRDLVGAVRAWTVMKQQKVVPNPSAVEALLKACRTLGHEKTSKAVLQMREKENWILTLESKKCLYEMTAKYGQSSDFIRLIMDVGVDLNDYRLILNNLKDNDHADMMKKVENFVEENYPSVMDEYLKEIEDQSNEGDGLLKVPLYA